MISHHKTTSLQGNTSGNHFHMSFPRKNFRETNNTGSWDVDQYNYIIRVKHYEEGLLKKTAYKRLSFGL